MTPGQTPLLYFRSNDDLERFFELVVRTYGGALSCIEVGGISTGDPDQAILVGRVVTLMLQYKAEQAAVLAQGGAEVFAEANAEADKVWPMFQAFLDEELAEASKIVEEMRAAAKAKLH